MLAAINVTCNNANNGSINVIVIGGTTPYAYNWGGGIILQNRTNLSPGTYTLTVTDSVGCTATSSSLITEPAPLLATATVTDVSCNGGGNGAITLNTSGGTLPYAYNWGGASKYRRAEVICLAGELFCNHYR